MIEIYGNNLHQNLKSTTRTIRSAVKKSNTATNFYSSSSGKRTTGTPTGSKTNNMAGTSKMSQTYRIYSSKPKTPKSKSVEPSTLNKNKMVNSFINGEGFGFNFYLNNNENENNDNYEVNDKKMSKTQNNFGAGDKKHGEEIDKLLNYYMKELNQNIGDDQDSNSDFEEGDVSDIINNNVNIISI